MNDNLLFDGLESVFTGNFLCGAIDKSLNEMDLRIEAKIKINKLSRSQNSLLAKNLQLFCGLKVASPISRKLATLLLEFKLDSFQPS